MLQEGYIWVLLNGGPSRAFSESDVVSMEDDLNMIQVCELFSFFTNFLPGKRELYWFSKEFLLSSNIFVDHLLLNYNIYAEASFYRTGKDSSL